MENEKFSDQWVVDEDGYTRCAYCQLKSDEELPKRCECSGYINRDGEIACKICAKVISDIDERC